MLPGRILGENPSLDQVSKPLVLPSSMEGYPFKISYATSHYARLKTDGVPQTADLPAEGETVTLTATYTCASGTFEQPIRVRVVPQEKSMEARVREEMEGAIRKVQEETLHEEIMPLPEIFHGKKIVWSRERSRAAPVLFLLVLVAAGCLYFAKDKELQKKMKQREESLKNAYPQFVSRLTLYLSAGMTVRGVFLKAADDYAKKRKEGTKKDALSEEIRRASAHLSNGVSETVVYERFAARCGLTEYTRLCSLLAQNLKKGSAHLLLLLRQEAQMSVREQMDRARVLGEQAGSRLMIPMMLMLMVVMVLVMVPAYLSF